MLDGRRVFKMLDEYGDNKIELTVDEMYYLLTGVAVEVGNIMGNVGDVAVTSGVALIALEMLSEDPDFAATLIKTTRKDYADIRQGYQKHVHDS